MPAVQFPDIPPEDGALYYYMQGRLTKIEPPRPDPPPTISDDLLEALTSSYDLQIGQNGPRRAAEFTTDRMVLPLPLEVVAASMVPAIPLEFIVPLKTPEFKEFKPIKFT